MVKDAEWQEISKLLNLGLSVPEVSARTARSTGTIYKLVKQGGPRKSSIETELIPKKIIPFTKYLDSRIKIGVNNGSRLFEEIISHGYQGSRSSLNNYLRQRHESLKIKNYKIARRVETEPGEQAQVDWSYFGEIEINGREEKLYAFVYVLSYSRMAYVEFTTRQTIPFLEQCHINAFNKLGIPKKVLYDNMKTVVISRGKNKDKNEEINYNLAFRNFSDFYNSKITLCPTYWPRAKGKVERSIRYLDKNFMQGMRFKKEYSSIDDLNMKVKLWCEKANRRIHSTLKETPYNRWVREKEYLRFPNNLPSYQISPTEIRKCNKDAVFVYKNNFYKIANRFATSAVNIKEFIENGMLFLYIFFNNRIIAKSLIPRGRGNFLVCENFLPNQEAQVRKVKARKTRGILVFSRPIEYYSRWFFKGGKFV